MREDSIPCSEDIDGLRFKRPKKQIHRSALPPNLSTCSAVPFLFFLRGIPGDTSTGGRRASESSARMGGSSRVTSGQERGSTTQTGNRYYRVRREHRVAWQRRRSFFGQGFVGRQALHCISSIRRHFEN